MSTEHSTAEWQRRIELRQRPQVAQSACAVDGIAPAQCSSGTKNVGLGERLVSFAAGTALGFAGRKKGDFGGALLALAGIGLIYRAASGHCYCYQALGISTATNNKNTVIPAKHGVKVQQAIIINRPASELYEFWRDLTNLPRVFTHLQSVELQDGNVSHWVAVGPMNVEVEWDAEILNDHENKLIAWRSLPGSQVDTAGSIRFQSSDGRGTTVTVAMKYNPPGGIVADHIASWIGEGLESKVTEDLQRFKSVMETGEILTSKD